jgi:transposase-like protein
MAKAVRATKREEWKKRITEFRASGLTGAAWCAMHGVKPHQLYYWLQQMPVPKAAPEAAPSQWMPLVVGEDQQQESPAGVRVRVGRAIVEVQPRFDPVLLTDVMRVLTALC